nr:myb-like protein X isoform X1 [Danaus plexippus plexippus]
MSLLMLILIFVSCDSLSIGAQKNVKRDIENNFNPDWAQLKNTQEGELKELIQVRAKPKKRLALPVNFILRAVAEPEGDDYYDKGQGESDNEDYFEKREWSDLHRPVQAVDANTPLNPANLSDIDGIINIITKPVENPIEKNSRNRKVKPKKGKVKNKDKIKREYGEDISDEDLSDNEKESEEVRKGEPKTKKEKQHRYEDDVDYEEGISEKQKSDTVKEEEQRENEAKKIKILQSVDELKAKHAQEQRAISEKAKEEEIHKEEIERDRIKAHPNIGKYDHMGSKWKKVTTDYNDEYEDQEPELKDKYKINHWKSISVEPTAKVKPKKIKTVTGKLSVFRNPHLYMINDDEDEITTTATRTTTKTIKLTTSKPKIYSSKYSAPPEEDNVRISLVPEDESKEGEPTLFFPKVKNIRKSGIRTTNAPDSFTSEDRNISLTSLDPTAPSTTFTHTPPSAQDTDSSASQSLGSTAFTSVPTEIDTGPSAIDQDLKSSPSEEMAKKEAKKNQNYDVETGKEKEHHSKHEESHEEHGRKAYEDTGKSRNVQERNQQSSQPQQLKHWYYCYTMDGVHKEVKTNKGHHDEKDHLDKYDDHGEVKKKHHDEKRHYGSHHHEETGKKHAKYEESGKHSKGHSTKGSHDIHKKDEYEKKVEFFEEEGDAFEDEADGGHHKERERKSGGHYKKGYRQAGYSGREKGDRGVFSKGSHGYHDKGHRHSSGRDSHGGQGGAHHKTSGVDGGRKWIYHHGHPAKTANLVVIDRRADSYQHGPQYYG